MKLQWLGILVLQAALPAFAGAPADFSGVWELNAAKSQNIGMMAQMKMTVTIQQSDSDHLDGPGRCGREQSRAYRDALALRGRQDHDGRVGPGKQSFAGHGL